MTTVQRQRFCVPAETEPRLICMPERTPTLEEVRKWPATVDIPTAARALGISRAQMYRLVATGEAPVKVLDCGTKRVVTASLVRLLEAE